ncbi:MAG: PAS domain-containing protein [Deltaproteobacteria bacterium]|nr:PAS domain-containing protein [Deltaproteobacteria bacterium]
MKARLIDRLNKDQIEAILDSLPLEFIFVDENDCLQYYNKGNKRSREDQDKILGNDIRSCHKPESLPKLDEMLNGFKDGKKDEDEFWVDGLGVKLLNRFLAVRDSSGKYMGCVEYLLNFTKLEKLAEEKKDAHRFVPEQDTSEKDDSVGK